MRAVVALAAAAFVLGASAYDIVSSADAQQEFFSVPSGLSSSAVGLIPGSEDFYQELFWRDDQTWTVCTNRFKVALTNADVGPVFADVGSYHAEYDWRPVVLGLGLTPTQDLSVAWTPSKFDFAVWTTDPSNRVCQVRFTANGDGTNATFSAFYPDGRQLFQPRSMRLTPENYMALVSTYAAYFERLYYASEGQTNQWSVSAFGGLSPGQAFAFNISNDVYFADGYFDFNDGTNRSVSSSRWLVEWRNLCRLRRVLRDGFFYADGEASAVPPNNPAFVYRPKWLLDRQAQPVGGNVSRLWWSSTQNPPTVKVGPTLDNPGVYQDPATDGFGQFPTFEWTARPIANWVQGSGGNWYWQQTEDWATRCVTLHMASGGSNVNPCRALFEAVGYDETAPLEDIVKPYDFDAHDGWNVQRWMTNVFPVAVSAYYSPGECWSAYKSQCWGSLNEDATTRRLAANDYTGCNDLLAAMNRTYHIPSTVVCSTNELAYVKRKGYYESDVSVTYDIADDGKVTISSASKSGNVALVKQDESNEVASAMWVPPDGGVVVRSTDPSYSVQGIAFTGESAGAYFLREDFLSDVGRSGTNVVYVTGCEDLTGAICVHYIVDGVAATYYLPMQQTGVTGPATIAASAERRYLYDWPISVGHRAGPTQPGASGLSRVSSSSLRSLERVEVSYTNSAHAVVTNASYRSSNRGVYDGRQGIEAKLSDEDSSIGSGTKARAILANGGYDPSNYASYAPFKNTVGCHYELDDADARLVFSGFTGDTRNVVTNDIYYTFENGTNNSQFQEWETTTLSELRFTRYNVAVTVYEGSGLVVSNVTEISSEIIPQGSELTTNEVPVSVWIDTTSFVSGPYLVPVVAVDVPWVYKLTKDWYWRTIRRMNGIDELNVFEAVMSGTGPDDPGTLIRTDERQDSVVHDPEDEDMGVGYDHSEVSVNEVIVRTSTSEAEQEGEGVVELVGRHMIRFVKTGDVISDVAHFVHWYNPLTGKFYYDVGDIWPMQVARYLFVVGVSPEITGAEKPSGGCHLGVEAKGDYKVMTCVDWNWQNMRLE